MVQYFVAFEDAKALHWQVELLYESIRLLGLSHQFIAAIQPSGPVLHKLPYPNVIYFKNGDPCKKAMDLGILKSPYVVLQPDMFLLEELSEDIESKQVMPLWCQGHCGGKIVHYEDGLPPYFHKDKVFDTINFSFKIPMPFKLILDIPSQHLPNVAVMQTLVRSWLDFNLTRVHCLL